MKLVIVGCSGSFAGPDSPASCYLLQAEFRGRTWSIVLDCGSGALGPLQRHTDPLALDGVVLSHLHADHFLDLCGLYVMHRYRPERRVASAPIRVFGPADTPARVGLAYYGKPTATVPGFSFTEVVDGTRFGVGPFKVQAYAVNHPIEAYGYRIECDGVVLAFTGDTDSCAALGPLMANADLVLADSAFVDGRDVNPGVHLSGSRAAHAALEAGGVRRLMLTHMPSWNHPEVCRAQAAAIWPGKVEIARPGATYLI